MPKKRRPGGRAYKRPDYKAERARLNPEKYAAPGHVGADELRGTFDQLKEPQPAHIDKPAPAPAHPHVAGPSRASRLRPRYLVAGAAGAGALGGAGYLIHRSRRRNTVKKGLIDPLTGVSYVVEKRYIEDDLPESTGGVLVAKSKASVLERASAAVDRHPVAATAGLTGALVGTSVAGTGYAIHRGKKRARSGRSPSGAGVAFGGFPYLAGYASEKADAANRAKAGTAHKRADDSAAFHLGRSNGRRTPVSSTRVSGLPVQSASFSRGHPWERPGTSHANRLTHVRHHQKQNSRGKLVVIRRGGRSLSGSSVGKSTQFGQSAGVGRRIVSAY